MTLDELIEALENARVSDELYESERESDDELVASVDGLCLPIAEVTVFDGQVTIHVDMYQSNKNKEKK
jgi:hypothetical protein